jgi:hypothetical protein
MRDPAPPVSADQVLPEPKQFITAEQFEEIWDLRGLKYRIDDLHVSLLSRGLNVAVNREVFRTAMHEILLAFFVKGDARLSSKKSPIPRFPKVY